MPDGRIYNGFGEHRKTEYKLQQAGLSLYPDEDTSSNDEFTTLEKLGCIRLNLGDKNYSFIILPKNKPSKEQFDSLLKCLDYMQENYWLYNYITLQSSWTGDRKEYKLKEYTSDEILKDIKKYYAGFNVLNEIYIEESLSADFESKLYDFIAGGWSVEDIFDEEDIEYMNNNLTTCKDIYRIEVFNVRDYKIGDVVEFNNYRSFTKDYETLQKMIKYDVGDFLTPGKDACEIFNIKDAVKCFDISKYNKEQEEVLVKGTFKVINIKHMKIDGVDIPIYVLSKSQVYVEESLHESKQEYQKKFDERTRAHIERVNKYAKKIDREYPNHDSDKFNELYDGYSLMSKDNVTKEEQALIDDATFKHVRDNEHHCEHWVDEKDIEGFSRNNPTPHGCLDCSKMPESALEEMCCDWCAMSEEFNNTPFEWYEKNKDTRWHFNEKQDKFILDTLHKLWDNVILDESKQDIENFKQWAGEDLAWRFFNIKDRIKDNQKDIYYWINLEKKQIEQMKNHPRWKDNYDELVELVHNNTLNTLDDMIKEYEKTPPKRFRDKLAQSGSTKVFENNKWLVLEIRTYEASAKYGKGTNWCISASDDASQGRDDFFLHTLDEDAKMYFFIEKGGNRKYALEYVDDENWVLFDETDTPQIGYGMPFNNALDALNNYWTPYEDTWYPDLPHVDGLPDIQQAYIDDIKYCKLDPKDFEAK